MLSLPRFLPLRRLGACVLLLLLGSLAVATEWQPLFDGKTLAGWTANENPGTWSVEDGAIVSRGPRSHLFYQGNVAGHDFRNFEFSAEVMSTPGSNSGIYIHTAFGSEPWPVKGYECQIINSPPPTEPGKYVERKMTGSIYAVRNTWRSPVPDHVWFEYRIRVSGRTLQTFINGALICDYTEAPEHWRAPDKQGRRLDRGTFALQGHDPHSVVRFRNVRVRLLPDDAPSLGEALTHPELETLLAQFADRNFPLIDLGLRPDGAISTAAIDASARELGFTPGYHWPDAATDLSQLGGDGPVLVINDRDAPPSVPLLKAAKAQGARVAFSSGGISRLDPTRILARLQAIREAGLAWNDLWVPTP